MGYNISRHAVERNRPQLDDLLALRKTFEIPTASPQRLASKLWEAIRSARELSERYPQYAKYAEISVLYRLRQTKTGVLCEWVADLLKDSGEDTKSPTLVPTRMEFPEAASVMDVIATVTKFSDMQEIRFPNAVLQQRDRKKLYNWTKKEGVTWRYISHDDAGLTLTKKEVPEELLWNPES